MPKVKMWLMIILLVAAFLRFWDLKNIPPGLWADEAMNGNNALEAGWKVFYPENFGREGLFINIQSLSVTAFGNKPWALRLPSAIFGILTVLGLYLMTRKLFRERIALFTAFFIATSFWHINFSRIGFRAIMAPFFLVWAFYFLFLGIRKTAVYSPRGKTQRGVFPTAVFALAGLTFGLGFHTYIAYRIAPLIALFPLWKFYPVRASPAERGATSNGVCRPCLIVLFIFMALVAASPLLIYYAQNPQDFFGRTVGISIFQSENPALQFLKNVGITLAMFNFVGDFNWRHNLAGSPQLWWPIGILFLVGLLVSIRKSMPNHKFLLLWFVAMLFPVAVSNEGLPHALRAIVLIPPAMIFAALGLETVIQKIDLWLENNKIKYPERSLQIMRIKKELLVLLIVFFIAATLHAYNSYFLRWAPDFNTYQAFQTDLTQKANWLNAQPREIKKYVVTGEVERVDLRGSPMSLQPIIFLTNTFFETQQKEKNIYYLTADEIGSKECEKECVIVPVELNTSPFRK